MDGLTLIPLLAFTMVACLCMYIAIDELSERGLSFADLARFFLKLALSSLFLLPVSYALFDKSGEWYTFVGMTTLLLLATLSGLIDRLRQAGGPDRPLPGG
jgi:hypothetical protein